MRGSREFHGSSYGLKTYQIGKELLLPELPLTIRLIGLRITKLKDLHAAEPAGGIKRVSAEKIGE